MKRDRESEEGYRVKRNTKWKVIQLEAGYIRESLRMGRNRYILSVTDTDGDEFMTKIHKDTQATHAMV